MNQQCKLLLEYFEEHKQRTEDLKTQLKHSRQTVSRLEAEKRLNRDDSELQHQLAKEKLNCNKLQTQLVSVHDNFDDQRKKLAEENARLREDKPQSCCSCLTTQVLELAECS